MADTEDISIHINDYSLWYGNFQALFNVTVDIRPGIVTSMIGPSGCGKTTLLRSLNRINERYGGDQDSRQEHPRRGCLTSDLAQKRGHGFSTS